MTSNPLSVEVMREGVAIWLGVSSGETEGKGDSEGVVDDVGVGVGDSRLKNAHGLGRTLAHSLCWPGASPANGLTRVLKLPLASAVAEPATLFD